MPLVDFAKAALWNRFHDLYELPFNQQGYLTQWQDNLLAEVDANLVLQHLGQGAGNELARKFRAIHSSSALAANSFGRWISEPQGLTFDGATDWTNLVLEWQPEVWINNSPPNLDVWLRRADRQMGVESKLMEHLTPTLPRFAAAYQHERFPNCDDIWWGLLEEVRHGAPQYFDVAQIIKHALGLSNVQTQECPARLVYIYWEPLNAHAYPVFKTHRQQVTAVVNRVQPSQVPLQAMTYAELWNSWEATGDPLVQAHVQRLRSRYEITI